MTTIVLPDWLPWLFLCALCVGLALGLIHLAFWPGQVTRYALPVWATQIIGVAAIWIGFYLFYRFAIGDALPAGILAVFVAFAGAVPLLLRFLRWVARLIHFERFHSAEE